ncbi:hypothetical protein PoB_006821900 [Plakobranchus ocellatus]|uniref:Uncharacterized protein n=1 Tax=Plakobranchus ocellatus TaxID=259542 RepID=A0AAV4DC28_9GAST|nr:hypothetical protein PoB_006821900 [Plakobranchus ocellatus]
MSEVPTTATVGPRRNRQSLPDPLPVFSEGLRLAGRPRLSQILFFKPLAPHSSQQTARVSPRRMFDMLSICWQKSSVVE